MKVDIISIYGTWREIANSARTTIGLDGTNGKVSDSWKKRMLLCEHSPTRKLKVSWKWTDLPYWISTHFVRHKFGIEHFVSTQRTDRTGIDRNELPQGSLVMHEAEANAQTIINISRRRLCTSSSVETRNAWRSFLDELKKEEPELVSVCVPDCIYRGHCYEYQTCGFSQTPEYKKQLEDYRRI